MKISFIGLGKVGSATVFSLLNNKKIDEILLIDIVPNLLEGEYLDLLHAASGLNSSLRLNYSGSIEDVKGSHLIVISAGFPRKSESSRLDLAIANSTIVKDIIEKIKKVEKDCLILMVTNPVDINTYIATKVSGFKRKHVFGMGSILDFSRFKIMEPKAKMIMGEHGNSMVFVPYNAKEESKEYTKKISKKVIELKGGTWWAPAVAIGSIIDSIVNDRKDVKVVSTLLDDEYGIKDVCLGIPVRLGINGIEEIIEMKLNSKELEMLKKSAEILKEVIKDCERHLKVSF
jgi:malate/lactate dehydrogenase